MRLICIAYGDGVKINLVGIALDRNAKVCANAICSHIDDVVAETRIDEAVDAERAAAVEARGKRNRAAADCKCAARRTDQSRIIRRAQRLVAESGNTVAALAPVGTAQDNLEVAIFGCQLQRAAHENLIFITEIRARRGVLHIAIGALVHRGHAHCYAGCDRQVDVAFAAYAIVATVKKI